MTDLRREVARYFRDLPGPPGENFDRPNFSQAETERKRKMSETEKIFLSGFGDGRCDGLRACAGVSRPALSAALGTILTVWARVPGWRGRSSFVGHPRTSEGVSRGRSDPAKPGLVRGSVVGSSLGLEGWEFPPYGVMGDWGEFPIYGYMG